MESLFFLIPLALIFCLLTVKAFFWAVNNHQFENLDSAAYSIFFEKDDIGDARTPIDAGKQKSSFDTGKNDGH